eukprot:4847900-Pleurochrysis_carterae.AAC.1
MLHVMDVVNAKLKKVLRPLDVQIGIHSGSAIAGIIGHRRIQYDLVGDAANTAARMCSNSRPGRVLVSQTTYELLAAHYDVTKCEPRFIKGKGMMQTYYLDRRLPSYVSGEVSRSASPKPVVPRSVYRAVACAAAPTEAALGFSRSGKTPQRSLAQFNTLSRRTNPEAEKCSSLLDPPLAMPSITRNISNSGSPAALLPLRQHSREIRSTLQMPPRPPPPSSPPPSPPQQPLQQPLQPTTSPPSSPLQPPQMLQLAQPQISQPPQPPPDSCAIDMRQAQAFPLPAAPRRRQDDTAPIFAMLSDADGENSAC